MSPHDDFVTLSVIFSGRDEGKQQVRSLHLPLVDSAPITIGTGRYATVVMAQNAQENPDAFYAIKFLKRNRHSDVSAQISRLRFIEEIRRTAQASGVAVDNFVRWIGFGAIKPHGYKKEKPDPPEVMLLQEFATSLEELHGLNSEPASSLPRSFMGEIAGPFYGMELEYATLDELLRHPFALSEQRLFRHAPTHQMRFEELEDGPLSERITSFLGKLFAPKDRAKLKTEVDGWPDLSGLTIINQIGKAAPKLKNQIVFSLFQDVVNSVASLHQLKDPCGDASHLAHRDIKLGNFLLRWQFHHPHTTTVKLSDLGFAGDLDSIQNVRMTGETSFKEPGVLAPGTFMFRAPEQVDAGLEISFAVETKNGEAANVVEIFNASTFPVRVGDRFVSEELVSTRGAKTDKLETFSSRVNEVRGNHGVKRLTLKDAYKPISAQSYYQGYILRQTGQHTDIFSLGCLLYFLASGGKNPEKFYNRCLEPFEHRSTTGDTKRTVAQEVFSSALSLSLSLCLESQDQIKHALQREIYPTLRRRDAEKHSRHATDERFFSAPPKRSIVSDLLWSNPGESDRDELVAAFCQAQRQNPGVQHFVTDYNGNPIPLCVLFMVARLMLRDAADGYIQAKTPIAALTETDISDVLQNKVAEDINTILAAVDGSCDYRLDQIVPGCNATSLLVLLRLLVPQIAGRKPTRKTEPATEPVETETGNETKKKAVVKKSDQAPSEAAPKAKEPPKRKRAKRKKS